MNEYKYSDIEIGMKESFSVVITEEMVENFLQITGDTNPLHNDASFAKSKGFSNRVVYGMLTSSFYSTLAGVYLPGKFSLIQSVETKFIKPVLIDDELQIEGVVADKNDVFKIIDLKITIRNQRNEKVCRGSMRIGVIDE